jgi:hypothetical protein
MGQVLKILINTEYTDNTVSLEFADQNPEPGTWNLEEIESAALQHHSNS